MDNNAIDRNDLVSYSIITNSQTGYVIPSEMIHALMIGQYHACKILSKQPGPTLAFEGFLAKRLDKVTLKQITQNWECRVSWVCLV